MPGTVVRDGAFQGFSWGGSASSSAASGRTCQPRSLDAGGVAAALRNPPTLPTTGGACDFNPFAARKSAEAAARPVVELPESDAGSPSDRVGTPSSPTSSMLASSPSVRRPPSPPRRPAPPPRSSERRPPSPRDRAAPDPTPRPLATQGHRDMYVVRVRREKEEGSSYPNAPLAPQGYPPTGSARRHSVLSLPAIQEDALEADGPAVYGSLGVDGGRAALVGAPGARARALSGNK